MKAFAVAVYQPEYLSQWRYLGEGTIINLPEGVRRDNMNGRAFADVSDNKRGVQFQMMHWCDTRPDAEVLAQEQAKRFPGCDVMVLEARTIYVTPVPANPTRRNVSEKGILP